MTQLTKSPVHFDVAAHTYELNGKRLSGVTAIVKWLYPDTYANIPQYVLDKAADYGHLVHSKCELYDSLGVGDDMQTVKDYVALKERYGLTTLCSEYLIDDGAAIASSIDKVFAPDEDGTYPLGDLKTTSKVHTKNVGLQLSIYAYLFERCNPGLKAGRLLVVWLPNPDKNYGTPDIIEVPRIPAETCKAIMEAYVKGGESAETFRKMLDGDEAETTAVAMADGALPAELMEVEQRIIDLEAAMKASKQEYDDLKAGMLSLMEEHNVKKWESDRLQIVRKLDSTRESLDSTALKKAHPDIYEQFKKVSPVKGSITIKVK